MPRAITHIHTRHSWDGVLKPSDLLERLVDLDVGLAVVTDHDSFAGARECRQLAKDRGLDVRIPVAAEVRTDLGDVVVVFEDDSSLPDIEDLKQWTTLSELVRSLGGLIWLPHPYEQHNRIEALASASDVVEVFNARCSEEQNRQAALLCERHGCVPAYGADVHRPAELGGCLVEYPDKPSTLEMLLQEPDPVALSRTTRSNIMEAQIAYGIKTRRPLVTAYAAMRWGQYRYRNWVAER